MLGKIRWVVIADRQSAFALERDGAGNNLKMLDEMFWSASELSDYADHPGRSFASTGKARSALEPHMREGRKEGMFAKTIIDDIRASFQKGKFDSLILVAGPRMLSALVDQSKNGFDDIEIRTLQRNLVNVPVHNIIEHLQDIMAV